MFGAEVTLSSSDFGANFGGYSEVGTTVVDIPANGQVTAVFEQAAKSSNARQCFQAKIDATSMTGGNEIESDDAGAICFDVVVNGDLADYELPVRNFGEGPIEVQVDILRPPTLTMSQLHLFAPNAHQRARRRGGPGFWIKPIGRPKGWSTVFAMDPGEEVTVRAIVDVTYAEASSQRSKQDVAFETSRSLLQVDSFFDISYDLPPIRRLPTSPKFSFVEGKETSEVVLMVKNLATDETTVVSLAFVPGSVEEVLNYPHFCCIDNLRLRLRLESILARALHFYEQGELKKMKAALQALRFFIEQTTELECDSTSADTECMERAIIAITDAAKMISGELPMLAPSGEGVKVNATEKLEQAWITGDGLRQQGMYSAAVLAFGNVAGRQSFSTVGAVRVADGPAVWGGTQCSARALASGDYMDCTAADNVNHQGQPDEKRMGLCCRDL